MLEELGPGRVVRALVRHVDGEVADQADPTLVRVAPQRQPLALEADLVGERAVARVRGPVCEPVPLPAEQGLDLLHGHGRLGLREQSLPAGEGGSGLVRRTGFVGRPER